MRALIQRVKHAAVTIDGVMQGQIEQGILILLGICEGDTVQDSDYLADKCTGLRIFTDENDKMNLSCADIGGQLLIVSQFTLYGDCKKGKRPNFMRAARPRRQFHSMNDSLPSAGQAVCQCKPVCLGQICRFRS